MHNVQKYTLGYIIDLGPEIIREDQGADWYRFEHPNRGVPGGRHRFERDGDDQLLWSVIFSQSWKETRVLCRE